MRQLEQEREREREREEGKQVRDKTNSQRVNISRRGLVVREQIELPPKSVPRGGRKAL